MQPATHIVKKPCTLRYKRRKEDNALILIKTGSPSFVKVGEHVVIPKDYYKESPKGIPSSLKAVKNKSAPAKSKEQAE